MPTTPRLSSRTKNPAHDIVLTDGIRTFGLKVEPDDISEIPQTPSTLRLAAGGGASAQKYGDFEPSMAQIVQADWSGGRGQENFSDDPAKFFDSQSCWTMTPNKLTQGPRWMYARGPHGEYAIWPDEIEEIINGATLAGLTWKALVGTTRYLAQTQVLGASIVADFVQLWVRRSGSPGTLTVEIQTNTAGAPSGVVLQSVTKTVSDITDTVSLPIEFDWTGTQTLNFGTTYWVVVYGASTDNTFNHWDIGINTLSTTGSLQSTAGSVWSTGPGHVFHRYFTAATESGEWILFTLDSALYAVCKEDNGTAPTNLYINGARGKATAGASTTLTDTNASFPLGASIGLFSTAVVKIINGTGEGQTRVITSHTATVLTVPAWDITPDTTSEYVVYGTSIWTALTGHGLTKPVKSVCVTGSLPGTAYFAQGTATMRRMRFNASAATPAHEYADDGSNTADLLYTFYDTAAKKSVIWRAINSNVQISRADAQTWGNHLTFGTGIPVGSTQFLITGLSDYDKVLHVLKEDSVWTVTNDAPEKLAVGLDSSPHPNNGKASLARGLFFYFSYMHSLEKLYGGTLQDIGPWRGSGVPSGRTGVISCITAAFDWIFVGVDAGTAGVSSVLCYNGTSWHEIWRGWKIGARVRGLYWQACEGAQPILWIALSDQFVYMRFPINTLNPLNDSNFAYQHEGVVTTSIIDMGNARLPKLFKELNLIQKNLTGGRSIAVDYQLDSNIGGSAWTNLGSFLQSPEDTIYMGFGNARQIRLRYRLITHEARTPTEVRAMTLEGYARTPVKYQYNIRFKERPMQLNRRGGRDVDPDTLYAWLRECAGGAKRIRMRSRYKSMDNRDVIVEPPILRRQSADSSKSSWTGELSIVLRDA